MALADFRIEPFSHGGIAHDVYLADDGPCVLVASEIPGITPEVVRFAEDLRPCAYVWVLGLLGSVGGSCYQQYAGCVVGGVGEAVGGSS